MVFNRRSEPRPLEVVSTDTKPEPRTVSLASSAPPPPAVPSKSVIGKDLSIEGQTITIRCKGSLRVNGNIHADLHCIELFVGEQALIEGSVAAKKVEVFGHVNGAILGAEVILHSTARVDGDIHSQRLSMEQGASFDGRSRKVTDPAEVAPQLEAENPHVEADTAGMHY